MQRRLLARLRSVLFSPADPINLAVFRVTVFALLAILFCRIDFPDLVATAPALRVAPPGYGPFFHFIPWGAGFVFSMRVLGVAACLCAVAGLATRPAALLGCLSALYLLGLPQFFGKISHPTHALAWFAALLAASPCGDALSVDAWLAARRGRRRASGPAVAYGFPLRCAWLLIGVAYWFPGLAKLRAGPEWIFSENLKLLMYSFWAARDFVPLIRIDRYPLLYQGAAATTVAVELGFLPALFLPRLRPLAIAAGMFFHLMVAEYLRIFFTPLMACYVVFVDWAALWKSLGARRLPSHLFLVDQPVPGPVRIGDARLGGPAAVAALLLVGNVYCGARSIDSWPFSAFPRFDAVAREDQLRSLEIVIRKADGNIVRIDLTRNDPALVHLLSVPASGRGDVLTTLEPYLRARGYAAGDTLQLYDVTRSTIPEERNGPPRSRTLRLEITP